MIVKVIDDRMGMSKTSAMIQYMNLNKDKKFVVCTPFLTECLRIKEKCGFVEPEKLKDRSKLQHFKELILSNRSIVTTHALFKLVDLETIEILKQKDYILVLDEVLDVVTETTKSEKDIQAMVELGILKRNKDGNLEKGEEEVLTRWIGDWEYSDIISNLLRNTLEFYNSNGKKIALMWLFPDDLIRSFKEVYILTYCFDGYPLKYYLDLKGIKQEKYSVEVLNPNEEYGNRMYKFVPYFRRSNKDIADKVKILEGTKINSIGESNSAFSVTWYDNSFKKSEINIELKKNLINVCTNRFKNGKIKDIMWTAFLKNQESLHNERLKEENMIPHNIRATNDYRDKTSLVYLVNRRYNPVILNWFREKGINIDEDEYALGELSQWVWRSAIRDNGSIEIYIPSRRMRELLQEWLSN